MKCENTAMGLEGWWVQGVLNYENMLQLHK